MKILLKILLLLTLSTQAWAGLDDIDVITSSDPNFPPPPGFEKIDSDLNKGAKGDFVYLCAKWGSRPDGIVDLHAIIGDNPGSMAPPGGYEIIRKDLNKGSGGKYIFLCYRRSTTEPSIKYIKVLNRPDKRGASSGYALGWLHRVELDLNSSVGGNYIMLYYNKEGEPAGR